MNLSELFRRYHTELATEMVTDSVSNYRTTVRHFSTVAGVSDAADINLETFTRYRRKCIELGLSPHTIEHRVTCIVTLLRYAHEYLEVIEKVPPRGRGLKKPKKRPRMPSLAEVGEMYRCTDVAKWPLNLHVPAAMFWKCWLVTAYFTGLRLSDLMFTLKWDCVQSDGIFLEAQKTGRPHAFPIHPVLADHLKLMRGPSDRVFPINDCRKQILREMHRISRAAGTARPVTCQQLRRLAATQWTRAQPGAGRLLLGHSMGVSDFYVDIVPDLLEESCGKVRYPNAFTDDLQGYLQAEEEARQERIERESMAEAFPMPNRADWKFHGGRFSYRGKWYDLTGERLRLLRLLVEAGRPVDFIEVARVAYEKPIEGLSDELLRKRANAAVCRLREHLRRRFGWPRGGYNPVPCVERRKKPAWGLCMPPEFHGNERIATSTEGTA